MIIIINQEPFFFEHRRTLVLVVEINQTISQFIFEK
jgi:hypothetical protein